MISNSRTQQHLLIGIAGGSASGKTLVARRLLDELGSSRVVVIEQDSYYRELSHLSLAERAKVNFDHPDAFDMPRLIEDIHRLMRGESVEVPIYDYTHHNRRPETRCIANHSIVVLEGILVFWAEELRRIMDVRIYVDTPDDIRLLRRVRRDILERGRRLEGVLEQYENKVRPMHMTFVEPSKQFADIIVPHGGENRIAIDLIRTKINDFLGRVERREPGQTAVS